MDGEKQFEVLSTNGDTFLVARTSTSASSTYLIDSSRKESGINLANDPLALQR